MDASKFIVAHTIVTKSTVDERYTQEIADEAVIAYILPQLELFLPKSQTREDNRGGRKPPESLEYIEGFYPTFKYAKE